MIVVIVLGVIFFITVLVSAKKEDDKKRAERKADEKPPEQAPRRRITSYKPLFTIDDSVRMNGAEKEELKRLLGETAVFLEKNAGQPDEKNTDLIVYEGEKMKFSKPVHELCYRICRREPEGRLELDIWLRSTLQGSVGGKFLCKGTPEELLEWIQNADIEDIAGKAAEKADALDRFYDWD